MSKWNSIAKDVRTPKYRMRVVRIRKGKKSYTRKKKYKMNKNSLLPYII